MRESLLITLPLPEPVPLLTRLRAVFPDLQVTFIRHNVFPTEAFVKQDMDIPPEILHNVTVLMTMGYVPEPADAPNLRLIHFSVAGTEHAKKRAVFQDGKISITSSVGAPSPSVAEYVIGTMICHFRQLFSFQKWQESHLWGQLDLKNLPGSLSGKKIAIVGYGSIGREVARISKAMGMEIIVYTSKPRLTAASRNDPSWCQENTGDVNGVLPREWFHGTTAEELHAFLSQGADVVVLSLPLTPDTKHMIGSAELEIMNSRKPVFLVNVARGAIIEHDALVQSLKRGKQHGGLQGAALDVTDPEPLKADSELWNLPNVFISPHVSSITPETTVRAFKILEENIRRLLHGKPFVNVVKASDVQPQEAMI